MINACICFDEDLLPNSTVDSQLQQKTPDLPDEVLTIIFSHLTLKALVPVSATSHKWEDRLKIFSVWTYFDGHIGLYPEKQPTKLTVLKKIKILMKQTEEKNSPMALQAYVTLGQLGFHSLDEAFDYAKTMT